MQLLKVLLFYILCCLSFSIHSQEMRIKIPLKKVLSLLEKKHQLQFNYLESNIKKEVFFNSELSLKMVLISLEKQTHLRFEAIDQKQIIIRSLKSTDLVSVCGYLMEDNFPLKKIEVQTYGSHNTVKTDVNGFFEIKNVPYGSIIVFRNEGAFLHKIQVNELFKFKCQSVKISSFSEELEEIIIPNYLTKGITKQAQKVHITSNKFAVLPGITEPDIMKTLEHIPSVQSPFEMPSKLYIRGSTPDQNLILWNGIRTYNPSHFFGLISAFNPYTVKETNFYAKGIQAKYGDRLGGVIDMKSPSNIHNKFSGGAGLNLISGDAFVNVPIVKDKLSFTLAARRSYTDVLETPAYRVMAERVFQNVRLEEDIEKSDNTFFFYDYNIGIQAKPSKIDALQFNAFFTQNNLDFKSTSLVNSYSDDLKTKNEGYSVQWQHSFSNKLEQETIISLSNYSLDYLFNNLNLITNEKVNETKKNYINDYGIQTSFDLDFNKNSHLQLGYQFSENNIRYEIKNATENFSITLDEQKNKLQTHSLFSEYEIDFNNKATVQLGLRGNKYSTSDQLFIEPRLYTEIALLPNLKLNTSLSYTSQAITQIEESITSSLTLENLLWRITDDSDFNILTSQQYSLGAIYKNKGWFLEADSFYKRTKNVTTLTAGFLNPFNNGFNIGSNKTIGAEAFIKKRFKNYSSWISYAFTNQKSQFDAVNNGDFFISNINVEHTFKWQHYYKLNNFQFSLGWLWHSGRATTNVTANKVEGKPIELLYDQINNENLPIYHKLDFSVLYDFKQRAKQNLRYQIGLSIQNVYNRKSILNREFTTTPGLDNELQIVDFNSLGFTPNASLRVFW